MNLFGIEPEGFRKGMSQPGKRSTGVKCQWLGYAG